MTSYTPENPSSAYVDDPLLDPHETAEYCSVSKSTVYKWARTNALPYVTVCSDLRFRRSDVNRFIQDHLSE